MTTGQLIDGILQREKGYQDNPADRGNAHGGATNWGITSASWGLYKRMGRPATRDEIRAITREQAAEFYKMRYILVSPFQRIGYEPLRVQLIDFGINSSNERAIRWLQRALNVEVTSVLDDRTMRAVNAYPGWLVGRALAAARLFMIDSMTDSHADEKQFEEGWESRALSFAEFPPV